MGGSNAGAEGSEGGADAAGVRFIGLLVLLLLSGAGTGAADGSFLVLQSPAHVKLRGLMVSAIQTPTSLQNTGL
jgi:hypothetical protein